MSLVSWIVVALGCLLFVCGVLASVMVGLAFAEDAEEMALALDRDAANAWAEMKGSVESEKHRLIAGAMKADREAALKRIGSGA